MLAIVRLTLGLLESNCYLLYDRSSKETLIIDPGDSADYIIDKITRLSLKPTAIIATHGHFDHIMAALELQLSFNLPFLVSKKDTFLVKRMRETAIHFIGIDPGPPPGNIVFIDSKKELLIGKNRLNLIKTPGHTPGGTSLYHKKQKFVFSGDLVFFGGGVGRTDFSYSETANLNSSIKKILKLPEDTVVYPGHGERTAVRELKKTLSGYLK